MALTMHRTLRIKVTDLNPHLACVLCGGYYIDATTITECLHSFCRTCIVRYLEGSKYCPICDVQVHKTRPLLHIRRDKTLQDLVYKLVPNLFKNEMERRRAFYAEHPEAGPSSSRVSEERGDIVPGLSPDKRVHTEEEHISLSLEYSDNGKPAEEIDPSTLEPNKKLPEKRYLLCPAGFTVGHLKKFIKTKFELNNTHLVQIFHTDEPLVDHYTLMDVAYIYTWRRKGPLRLYFTIYLKKETPRAEAKKRKISESSDKTEENDSARDSKITKPLPDPTLNCPVNGTSHTTGDDSNVTTSSSEEIVSRPRTTASAVVTTFSNVDRTSLLTSSASTTTCSTTLTSTAKPLKSETPAWLVAAMANAQKQAQVNASRVDNRKQMQDNSANRLKGASAGVNRLKTPQKVEKTRPPPKSTLEKALLAPSSKVFVSQHLQNNGKSQLARALSSTSRLQNTSSPVLSRVLLPGSRILTPGGVMSQRMAAPRIATPVSRSFTSSPEPVNMNNCLSKISSARMPTPSTHSPLAKITQTLQMTQMKVASNKTTVSKSSMNATTTPMPISQAAPKTGSKPGLGKEREDSMCIIRTVARTATVATVSQSRGPPKSTTLAKTIQKLTAAQHPTSMKYQSTMAAMNSMMGNLPLPTSPMMTTSMTAMMGNLPLPTSPMMTTSMTASGSVMTPSAMVRPPVSPLLNSSHSSVLSVPRSLPATNAAMAALKPTGQNIFKIMTSQLSSAKSVVTSKPFITSAAVTPRMNVTPAMTTSNRPIVFSKSETNPPAPVTSLSSPMKTVATAVKSVTTTPVATSAVMISSTPGSSAPITSNNNNNHSAASKPTAAIVATTSSGPPNNATNTVTNLPPSPSLSIIPSSSVSPPVVMKPPTPPQTKSPIAAPASPVYSDPPQEKSLDLSKKRKISDTNSNSETCLNGDHANGDSATNGDSCKRIKSEETR